MFKNYQLTSYVGERSRCEFSVLISHPDGGAKPIVLMGESIMRLFFPFHSIFVLFFYYYYYSIKKGRGVEKWVGS
jgi:hypothetical protein